MQLRPYQSAALAACWDYLRTMPGNPALVLPTGAGKSPLMAALASEAVQNWQGRVGIIAHVQELVEQNSHKLRAYWPDAPMGIYAAGLKRRDRFDKILFLQIQSVANRAHELGKFDLLLIDEAHRIPLKSEGMYRKFIDACRIINPALRVVGLTATPYRLQGQAVPVCGADHILTEIAYEARITDLIRDGFLSRVTGKRGECPDLSGVAKSGGDYAEASLAAAMMPLVPRTVADMLQRAAGRKAGIVFCVDVKHAEAVLLELRSHGENAALVHGGTSKVKRSALIALFQRGNLRWMVNVNVLSEGFDAPHIDCVAMLRPTKSPGLYYQQVGRGFRLAPGKLDCLVLDYAGNTLEHGPVDAIRVKAGRGKKAAVVQTAKAKECPKCQELLSFGVRICPACGYSFASADPAHSDRPVDAPVLSTDRERVVTTYAVNSVRYARHQAVGKPPCLRVVYSCGLRRINEFICIQHSGMAQEIALMWWQARSKEQPPRTVEEALPMAWLLPTPKSITVDETGKFPEILTYELDMDASRETPSDLRTDEAANEHALQRVRIVPEWLLSAVEASRTSKRAA